MKINCIIYGLFIIIIYYYSITLFISFIIKYKVQKNWTFSAEGLLCISLPPELAVNK